MSCDKLVYDLAQELDGSPNVFIKKDYLAIQDSQNGNYSSNQSIIETSAIANSGKWQNYREAYFMMPLLLTLGGAVNNSATAGNFAPATAATSADYAIGLKSWMGNMVHAATIELNNTTIAQQTPFCNMWNSFRLMTTLSWNDVKTIGSTIGFYPDDPTSWSFEGTVAPSGLGVCNNTNLGVNAFGGVVTGAFNNYGSAGGNDGFFKRQQMINYDADGDNGTATYAGCLALNETRNVWKSYVSQKVNGVNNTSRGVFQICVTAIVYLKHLHSFFTAIPLTKGLFLKMTLSLNNVTVDFTSAGGAGNLTVNSISNAVGGVCPLMLSSALAGNGNAALGALNYRANISVGAVCLDSTLKGAVTADGTGSRSVVLYVPTYTFNPIYERAYLASPIKTINYTDIYQYQITNIAAQSGQVNQLITNGIANLKSVLCIPFYTSDVAGQTALVGTPAYQSPYDPAGCGATSPLCLLSNFNVIVSGQQMLYTNQRYSFESFVNQLYGVNGVNGGLTDGLSSGLIDQLGFEMEYCYHYVNVSRQLPVEERVPKSVQIVGQNMSAKKIDLMVFCEYGTSVAIDVLTATRV